MIEKDFIVLFFSRAGAVMGRVRMNPAETVLRAL